MKRALVTLIVTMTVILNFNCIESTMAPTSNVDTLYVFSKDTLYIQDSISPEISNTYSISGKIPPSTGTSFGWKITWEKPLTDSSWNRFLFIKTPASFFPESGTQVYSWIQYEKITQVSENGIFWGDSCVYFLDEAKKLSGLYFKIFLEKPDSTGTGSVNISDDAVMSTEW